MSKTCNPIHLVINTYRRYPSIAQENQEALYRFIWEWMKQSGLFRDFDCRGKEYYAFGVGRGAVSSVIEYIKGQHEHHRNKTFEEELREFFAIEGIPWDDRMLT